MQRPQYDHRGDRGTRELGSDVRSNAGETEHLDMQHLAGRTRRIEVLATIMPQPEVEIFPYGGLLDYIGVALELVADRGPDEISPVRVETVLNHQIDMA